MIETPGETHGTRAMYRRGCKCLPCRSANAQYASDRAKRPNPGVDASHARAHLKALHKAGVGYRQAAKLSGLHWVFLANVRSGRRTRIRQTTEQTILAIQPKPANGVYVNSYQARHLFQCLLGEGYDAAGLAQALKVRDRDIVTLTATDQSRYARVRLGVARRVWWFHRKTTGEAWSE